MAKGRMTLCDKVAAQNDYEPDWVLDRFREKFNTAKRERG